MIVLHIDSGLGNQMLAYCEYLALKYANPNEDFYLETITFDIPECNEVISQWNGYELEEIFGINTPPNIKTLFTAEQWEDIMQDVRKSEFWKHNWNYPVAITNALNKAGLNLENVRGDFSNEGDKTCSSKGTWKTRLKGTRLGNAIRRYLERKNEQAQLALFENKKNLFLKVEGRNIFTGPWLSFYRRENNIELIEGEIRKSFVFPGFVDERDKETATFIESCNAVAIHVRRGDALYSNAWCYKYGYFKRAIKYIRKNVENPVFVFFTDPASVDWCKENEKIFGIDFKKEKVLFIDWHKGKDSFRDMQMMSHCKHAIITTSSFGWWGAYFIENQGKITISPYITTATTHHC